MTKKYAYPVKKFIKKRFDENETLICIVLYKFKMYMQNYTAAV